MNDGPSKRRKVHIPPQSGRAFAIKKGQIVRIVDVAGEQVADLFCCSANEKSETLSAGHTTDYNGKLFLSTGDILYSIKSRPMFTITADQVGRHIMLYAPCSQEMFAKSYGVAEAHPNCLDNLTKGLGEFGVAEAQITIPLNIFMNITVNDDGVIAIQPPRSKAGEYIELRAEMDLVVGVSACSAGACNNFTWTPIEIEVYEGLG